MHYEINVSRNGLHFFATAPRSIQNDSQLKDVYAVLVKKFPKSEGYSLTVRHHIRYSQVIDTRTICTE